jgi:hypothetical protein
MWDLESDDRGNLDALAEKYGVETVLHALATFCHSQAQKCQRKATAEQIDLHNNYPAEATAWEQKHNTLQATEMTLHRGGRT